MNIVKQTYNCNLPDENYRFSFIITIAKMKNIFLFYSLFALIILLACNNKDSRENSKTNKSSNLKKQTQLFEGTIYDLLTTDTLYTSMVDGIHASDLSETLQAKGPYTVFAFTSHATDQMPKDAWKNLLKPEVKYSLANIITYHIIKGIYPLDSLPDGRQIKTLEGKNISIVRTKDDLITVNGIRILAGDLFTSNGVIHQVEKVLLPKK